MIQRPLVIDSVKYHANEKVPEDAHNSKNNRNFYTCGDTSVKAPIRQDEIGYQI